jgi:ATP-dependent DNA ligase
MKLASVPTTAEVVWLCGYGPYGAALRLEEPKKMTRQAAQNLLRKKWQEKADKGYAAVAFEPFLASFGRLPGLPLLVSGSASHASTISLSEPLESSTPSTEASPPPFRYSAALLKAISEEGMRELLADAHGSPSRYTLSEKANGERCLVEFDGTTMRASNRKGRPMSSPPEGALALSRLGHPFVVDGERLVREQAGHYVLFDVLEWNGEDITALAYRFRLTRLVREMQTAGLLKDAHLTPTIAQARQRSTVPQLSVLLGVQGEAYTRTTLEEIQAAGGEGVVIRSLDVPYGTGGFKYKFLEDIDAFVIGIEPGISAGSLILAMVRPSDRAIVEVGHVRSGLTDAGINQVISMLVRGQNPVFRVTYLPASTIGMTLVQPKTSMDALRTDKEARECTTDQFGPEKAAIIAQARPISGIRVS